MTDPLRPSRARIGLDGRRNDTRPTTPRGVVSNPDFELGLSGTRERDLFFAMNLDGTWNSSTYGVLNNGPTEFDNVSRSNFSTPTNGCGTIRLHLDVAKAENDSDRFPAPYSGSTPGNTCSTTCIKQSSSTHNNTVHDIFLVTVSILYPTKKATLCVDMFTTDQPPTPLRVVLNVESPDEA